MCIKRQKTVFCRYSINPVYCCLSVTLLSARRLTSSTAAVGHMTGHKYKRHREQKTCRRLLDDVQESSKPGELPTEKHVSASASKTRLKKASVTERWLKALRCFKVLSHFTAHVCLQQAKLSQTVQTALQCRHGNETFVAEKPLKWFISAAFSLSLWSSSKHRQVKLKIKETKSEKDP